MLNNDKIKTTGPNGKEYSYFLFPYQPDFREKLTKIRNQTPNTFFDFQDIFGVRKSKQIDKALDFVKDLVRQLETEQIKSALLQQQINELYGDNVEDLIDQDVLNLLNDPLAESDKQQSIDLSNNDELFKQKFGFVPSSKSIKGEKKKRLLGTATHYKTDRVKDFTICTLDNNTSHLEFDFKTTISHKKFRVLTAERYHTLDEALKGHQKWFDTIASNSFSQITKLLSSATGVKI